MPKFLHFCAILLLTGLALHAQKKTLPYFKEGDSTRVASDSKPSPEVTIHVVIPDSIAAFKGATIIISPDTNSITTTDLSKVKLQARSEFKLDTLQRADTITYKLNVPRDKQDDRTLVLHLTAKDKNGAAISAFDKKMTVYVKPLTKDTLQSNNNWELWFMTGTNFDLFNGVKAEEFFFRANTMFKIGSRFYGQIAFYKNRYFTLDTSSGSLPYTNVKRPSGFGDTLHTFTSGNYSRSSSQTVDPLGLQLDVLFKLTDNTNSNFFATAGFDISTTAVSIKNTYTYDTSYYLQTSRPDTVKNGNIYGSSVLPAGVNYKKPAYNINLGFMWVLNDDEVNIKAQLTAGYSSFSNLLSYYQSKGNGMIYNFDAQRRVYLQLRMFATYKPMGICFGLESFMRQSEVPAFNFTLSKAFDIRGFTRNLTSVSSLNLQ